MSCLTCDSPRRTEIEADRKARRGWKDMAQEYGIDQQALRRHFSAVHQAQIRADEEPLESGDPGAEVDPLDIDIPADATPREKLKIVTDALEARIREGRYRAEDLREYRIALKDLHAMDREASGPSRVTMEDVEGLSEVFEALTTVLEKRPDVRAELLAELRKRGVEGVL